jgi:HlyD family secretion protein
VVEQPAHQARAQAAAQRAIVEKLRNGSRPEEIAQARADLANARQRFRRLEGLSTVRFGDQSQVRAVSQEDLDNARDNRDVAEAKLTVARKALDLAVGGPRKEEIAEAEAKLAVYQAALGP